jgi:hypothetical protein
MRTIIRTGTCRTRRGKKKAIFTPKGGLDLGVALARSAGAGMTEAVARKRKLVEAETKLRPKIWVAHCSGVRVLCV